MDLDEKPRIDAKTFQEPLWNLAETMAQKVQRRQRHSYEARRMSRTIFL
jgi:hypothetical protein